MAILSKSCVYGLRAVLYVSSFSEERKFVPIREIAEKLDLSFHFLTKILQQLTEAKLMDSYRGPNGGVRLVRDPGKISLFDIVRAIDGDDLFKTCVLGLAECSEKRPCPMHHLWGAHREELLRALDGMTLATLRDPVKRAELRLTDDPPAGRLRKG